MPEATADNPEGLSKNQLKKLAKKAEKQAKKAAHAGGGNEAAPAPASNKPPAPTKATPVASPDNSPSPAPTQAPASTKKHGWTIGRAQASSLCTIKVALASHVFGVDVTPISNSQVPSLAENDYFASSTRHTNAVLLFGTNLVGGGGNAMAKALRYACPTLSGCVPSVDLLVDEWCEWERSVLRSAKDSKAVETALQHLETALHHGNGGGCHLVGNSNTLADVVVSTTLDFTLKQHTNVVVPPFVQIYIQSHAHALSDAKKVAQDWEKACNSTSTSTASSMSMDQVDMTNPSLLQVVTKIFNQAALATLLNGDASLLPPGPSGMVMKCKDAKHGDYQCMAAMKLMGILKKQGNSQYKNPKDIAQVLIDAIGTSNPVISDLSIQNPAFIVCRIRPTYLQTALSQWLPTNHLPKPNTTPSNCVVDFSSPNIAKEMHVGHLRSTIIGEAVCRILEFCGYSVARTNHVGDWGTQFGMLIQYLREEYPDVASSQDATLPNITDLTVFYKNAKQRFDESPEFKEQSRLNVVALQSGDAECRKIWQMLCDVSRHEFEKVYQRLDVTLEEKGESFYNAKIPPVIAEFESAGLVSIEEGGAKCVFVDGHKIPLMLQKSDGGYGYDSTDMAALKYRLFDVNAKRIIVITDFSQAEHFQMCFAAAKKIGWLNPDAAGNVRLDHIGFGTVMGEDGKRFKTRSGDTVRLVDLLDEAVTRMEASLQQRMDDGKANITKEELHSVAEAIGYGAVKYFDLRRNPTTNYKFSYDQMLDTKGNTAVYLLYARVRLESICAKAKAEFNIDVEELIKAGETPTIEHASERNLVLQLQQFADTMDQTLEDLFPYHICEYVYNVSIAASDFVTQCKVLGSPEMKSRLLLCHATITAMHQCFDLLGIRHVKRI